jgi:threonine synthase
MNYYSLNHKAPNVSFKEAVIRGIAPDKGLYFPEKITKLPEDFFSSLNDFSKEDIAFQLIEQFVGDDIDLLSLERIIEETVSFDFPLVKLSENISTLELFHGPTMAFKDVGARFMARCLGHFAEKDNTSQEVTVLVATSGDTGGAVASGFLGVEGVKVVILYPSGKVSDIQEKQLTTLGQNITALEVDGTFDDCQAIVKNAFVDTTITDKMQLTSANSINVARWLPQSFYFAYAYKQLENANKPLVFSVPSGNFGNICAGMVAHKLGMPVSQFVASVNSNDVVPRFLVDGNYKPRKSVATISNAMDVGDPSNFIRIRELFEKDNGKLSEILSSYSFTDAQTKAAMQHMYKNYNYVADPHGAVGYLGLQEYLKTNPNSQGVFLETAHPIKFLDVVEETIQQKVNIPPDIQELIKKKKVAISIKNYEEFKAYMLQSK